MRAFFIFLPRYEIGQCKRKPEERTGRESNRTGSTASAWAAHATGGTTVREFLKLRRAGAAAGALLPTSSRRDNNRARGRFIFVNFLLCRLRTSRVAMRHCIWRENNVPSNAGMLSIGHMIRNVRLEKIAYFTAPAASLHVTDFSAQSAAYRIHPTPPRGTAHALELHRRSANSAANYTRAGVRTVLPSLPGIAPNICGVRRCSSYATCPTDDNPTPASGSGDADEIDMCNATHAIGVKCCL